MGRECSFHGSAFVHGCPGCAQVVDDNALASIVRSRLAWWRLDNLCRRYLGHWQRELEPGVSRCRVCGTLTFHGNNSLEQFMRWLG